MSQVLVVYTLIVTWIIGWIGGRFGLPPSIFIALLLLLPAKFGYRKFAPGIPVRRREVATFVIATLGFIGMSIFLITQLLTGRIDRKVMFDRELQNFRMELKGMSEFRDVEIYRTHRKGGHLLLRGKVADKESYDRLLRLCAWIEHFYDRDYCEDIAYPGKPIQEGNKTMTVIKRRTF